tara:strand:- start:504 stop:806 length:303 start_codon:yes stop_codon:yes gene_type:complete
MIGCDTEDCQYTYNKSEQLDRVQVLELKIRDMEKRIKYLEKIVHTSGMLNNDFNNLFINENSMINDDEILHKSIFSSNKLKSTDPPLIERQKAFNKSDNM